MLCGLEQHLEAPRQARPVGIIHEVAFGPSQKTSLPVGVAESLSKADVKAEKEPLTHQERRSW
jgi:hypothetical protein